MFIHLHNHSHYSILEWLPKPKDYVAKAKDLWMNAVAITDSFNVHGCHELYKEAKAQGITPIMWVEILVESSLDPKIDHKLVLLAKSLKWYRNILQLISKSNLEKTWTKAKIMFEDIKEFSEDIICLSWPISWEIPYYILAWKSDEQIYNRIKKYQELFWEENYFLELIYHDDIPKQQLITDTLIELSKKYDLQVVATNNCYYIDKEDKKTQDVIMALWTWHELENPDRPTLINWDFSFLTEEEMQTLFWFIPEALENTNKIAQMVNMEIETWWILIPTFELPDEHQKIYEEAIKFQKWQKWLKNINSDEWYLRYLAFEWLNWRYDYWIPKETIFKLIQKLDKPSLQKKLTETSPQELKDLSITYYSEEKKEIINNFSQDIQDKIERLEYELVVVHEMWFDAYFLIVADYINWARAQNIPVWPWRWSAAWSLMAFTSWITDIDPLPYKLLFERFLNPARVSMPDIDTDFSDKERDKVVWYCRDKYWADHVAQICTFGTFAARAAVKDVWRVYWIPFAEMNELAKLIPEKPWTKLKWALEDSPEFKEAYDTNPKYKEIIDNALKIEWNVRQIWVHACAVIIAPEPMTKFTALQHPPKDNESIVTQYSAYPLEDLWLLKMDFLWLRNLTIIKRTQEIIKAHNNTDIDVLKIDTWDQKVFEVFANWDTTWVFQFESDWMRKYLKDLAPNAFEDLIAMVSLYRPWPLAYIPAYINRKYWREKVIYLTEDLRKTLEEKYTPEEIEEEERKLNEDLWPILDVSYWIAVYQEQLMFIVQYMAWFSLWEADLLRRWVWKKKLDVIEALKKEFITKSANYKWYKPETSKYIYTEMIQPAANYSFNKSHAACYAFIAYQTAYLKAYYPTEFLTSVMVSDEENMERIVMEVAECEWKWTSVLPPSVQESLKHFTYINKKNIRFWLKAIKWIWDGPINRIIEARKKIWWKFENLEQFIETCWKEVINKKSLEALILSWAMDDLWIRKQMFESIPEIINFCKKDEKIKETNQIWLFDTSSEFEDKLELKETEEFSFEKLLAWEKSMIGFYVSGHPLDWLQKYCSKRSNNVKKLKMSFEELQKIEDKENPKADKNSEKEKEKKQKKEPKKEEIIQTVWVITDLRKIITKTWKQMMFLKCEWFDYDFEVVIFPKDLDKYKDKLELDKIVIVNGSLDINFEYMRKSIRVRDIKTATISMVREQAKDLWLFNNQKRYLNKKLNETKEDENESKCRDTPCGYPNGENKNDDLCTIMPENFDDSLEEKIIKNKTEKEQKILEKYILEIPKNAIKQDLLELKQFLESQEQWFTKIFINFNWQEIDTKTQLETLDNLEKWIKNKWKS